jgi:YidC/Oxa1 family membrane protein insertase
MLNFIWQTVLYQPLINGLIGLYTLFGNLGVAIIILTLIIRFLLIPLSLPSMRAASKMKLLAPKLEKLKKRYQKDPQGLMKAQMELYRQEKINPASGCLPQIIQIIILIALFQAFQQVLGVSDHQAIEKINQVLYPFLQLDPKTVLNLKFLYLDLTKPDILTVANLPGLPGLFLIAAVVLQFVSSKMMMPVAKQAEKESQKTPSTSDDLASAMQKQSLYLSPLMTLFIGFRMPSGLILYWFMFSLFTLIQQLIINQRLKKAQS